MLPYRAQQKQKKRGGSKNLPRKEVLVEGDPEEVITEESIRELYGIELGVTRVDGRKFVLEV